MTKKKTNKKKNLGYIVELDRDSLLFMAALLHDYLQEESEDDRAHDCLQLLYEQTDCVYKDSTKHRLRRPGEQPVIEPSFPALKNIKNVWAPWFHGDEE